MIQANELRYGNKVMFLGEIVTFIGIESIRIDNVFWAKIKETNVLAKSIHFNPIPITEEILLKCGFKGRPDFIWRGSIGILIRDGKYYLALKDLSNVQFKSIIELKYLHQLQNLYYSITNEELNIEL